MSEATKEVVRLTKKEWDTFKEIQTEYNTTMVGLGEVLYNKKLLEPRLEALRVQENELIVRMNEIRKVQEQFGVEIGGKYGDGQIDLATGIFNPTTG